VAEDKTLEHKAMFSGAGFNPRLSQRDLSLKLGFYLDRSFQPRWFPLSAVGNRRSLACGASLLRMDYEAY